MKNPTSVEEILKEVKEAFQTEPRLAEIFETCYTNTLNTTVKEMEDGTTYVITGDIPAMWLRDSTAQLRPYLIPAAKDPRLAELIAGSLMPMRLMKQLMGPAGKRTIQIRTLWYGKRNLRLIRCVTRYSLLIFFGKIQV